MRNLEIDIETYSSVSLQKCGVYKYAESPDFEILLFGYSADGGEVRVIDLASGETLPADVLSALTDDSVTSSSASAFHGICPTSASALILFTTVIRFPRNAPVS